MHCIVCDSEGKASREHVIAGKLGGRLITARVCEDCNNGPCSKLDSVLAADWFILRARIEYRVPGWEVAAKRTYSPARLDDGTPVKIFADRRTMSIESLGKAPTVERDEEGRTRRVTLHPRAGSSPVAILRTAKKLAARYGLREPTVEDVNRVLQKRPAKRPLRFSFQTRFPFNALTVAAAKIAYEFAAITLPKSYLTDDGAKSYRAAILRGGARHTSIKSISRFAHGVLMPADTPGACFGVKDLPRSMHVLRLMHEGDALRVRLRLFDAYEGAFAMTPTPDQFLKPGEGRLYYYDVASREKVDYNFRVHSVNVDS